MKAKVYCNKQDCSLRKTFIGDTGEYSRNLCCNADCELVKNDPPHPEATISGWVCRDKDGELLISSDKPIKRTVDDGTVAGSIDWTSRGFISTATYSAFPSLTWPDEPIEVEITIKPKKQ